MLIVMFVHSYTMLNDEQDINASKCQEPFEHWVIFLQKALSVCRVCVAVPVGAPVLVHMALAMVVAVVVASMGMWQEMEQCISTHCSYSQSYQES